jgi:hypothetical protein
MQAGQIDQRRLGRAAINPHLELLVPRGDYAGWRRKIKSSPEVFAGVAL